MIISFQKNGQHYQCDLSHPIDCSSRFGRPSAEPRAWHSPPVVIGPERVDDWVGAVAAGAPINFFSVRLNPHGNGTHSEGPGHLSYAHEALSDSLRFHGLLYYAALRPKAQGEDRVICRDQLPAIDWSRIDALAIAAEDLPFPADFSGQNPPYFEAELLAEAQRQGIQNFITNLASVDREEDGGALAAHRAFWHYPEATRHEATITELAHFPPDLAPGYYFYNLQIAPLHNDAAPARLLLYPLLKP